MDFVITVPFCTGRYEGGYELILAYKTNRHIVRRVSMDVNYNFESKSHTEYRLRGSGVDEYFRTRKECMRYLTWYASTLGEGARLIPKAYDLINSNRIDLYDFNFVFDTRWRTRDYITKNRHIGSIELYPNGVITLDNPYDIPIKEEYLSPKDAKMIRALDKSIIVHSDDARRPNSHAFSNASLGVLQDNGYAPLSVQI